MKVAKKKLRIQSPLVNPIIDLEMSLEKVLKKASTQESSVITPLVIMTLDPMGSTFLTMREDHLKSGLSGKTNYSRP